MQCKTNNPKQTIDLKGVKMTPIDFWIKLNNKRFMSSSRSALRQAPLMHKGEVVYGERLG